MKNNRKTLEDRFRLLIEDHEDFFTYSKKPLRRSIRVNTLKTTKPEAVNSLRNQGFRLRQIPWTPIGFWVEGSGLSETLEYFLGHYYLQESSTMIPPEVLNPTIEDFVLDVASAPGGKTTHMAALMENKGCIIANEVDAKRLAALRFNLSKHGVLNSIVTLNDLSRPQGLKQKFSRILLDAPCSCEGQFRKNPQSLEQWSVKKILRCSKLQKRMITNALSLLEEGGVLVYSTCTLAPEENEEVIDFALRKDSSLTVEPFGRQEFKYRQGITEWYGEKYSQEVANCARVYSQDNDSEGFFMAKIVKCGR
ncbi:MAG: RsmB/NOP family class I SAM-dependent RNA methyltransferase [Candidatus Altiarchaeota archaeon]